MLNKSTKYLILGLIALTALTGCEKRTEANVVSREDQTYYTAKPPELFTNQVNQVKPEPVISKPVIPETEYQLQQDVAFCLKKGNEKSIFCGETR